MKKILNLTQATIVAFSITFSTAFGSIVGSESFWTTSDGSGGTYEPGNPWQVVSNRTVTAGNTGFDATNEWGPANTSAIQIDLTSLTHTGVTGGTQDGSIRLGNIGGDAARNQHRFLEEAPALSTTYYLSGLVRYDTTYGAENTVALVGFRNTAVPGLIAPLSISSGFHYGLGRNADGETHLVAAAGDQIYELFQLNSTGSTVYQVVLELQTDTSGDDYLSAWYAPNGASSLTSALSNVNVGNIFSEGSDLRSLYAQYSSGGVTTGEYNHFDELRFGTTIEDVTAIPEPQTIAIYGAVLLFALLRIRRKLI